MSLYPSTNFHFPATSCTVTSLFYFYSILTFSISPSVSLPTATPPGFNASDYVLRNVFEHQDLCYSGSFVYVKESDAEKSSLFTTYSTTKECAQRLKEHDLPDKLPTCPPGLIDLKVVPAYVPVSQISWPYANLNISVTAHAPVETIAFRLHCLHASDGSDVYCSDSKDMYINGVKEWPCRGIDLSSKVKYPARFSYVCFRLTSYSTYAINATVLPQKCRVTTIVTAPRFDELYPDMLVDFSISHKEIIEKDPFWAPMIAADFSDDNAIWLRFGKAPRAECDKIVVYVYKEHEKDSSGVGKVTFLKELSVKCSEDSIRWENQKAGKYVVTAFVPIRGCKYFCEPNARGCRLCLRTDLHLEISETRASLPWLALQTVKDYSKELFIAVAVILGISTVVIIVFFGYFLYKRRKEANTVQQIQLTEFVKVMVVYADDNDWQTNCVKHLVRNLRNSSSCEPIFDLEQLITAEPVVPSRWLIEQLSTLNKFIIVLSECAVKILDIDASETHQLVQNRPFADTFGPAMSIIIGEATRNQEQARKKYAIVRFENSPVVPNHLGLLRLPVFILPNDFSRLTAFLHNYDYGDNVNITQNISQCRIDDWNSAVARAVNYTSENPNWINDRWKPKDFQEQDVMSLKRESPITFPCTTDLERTEASERLNLLPPQANREAEEADDEEEAHTQTAQTSQTVQSVHSVHDEPGTSDETAFLLRPPDEFEVSDSEVEEDEVEGEENEEEVQDEASETIVENQ